MVMAASKMRGVPPQMLELVAGLGEVWSAQTLAVPRRHRGAVVVVHLGRVAAGGWQLLGGLMVV